jgi:hypothetical protein
LRESRKQIRYGSISHGGASDIVENIVAAEFRGPKAVAGAACVPCSAIAGMSIVNRTNHGGRSLLDRAGKPGWGSGRKIIKSL